MQSIKLSTETTGASPGTAAQAGAGAGGDAFETRLGEAIEAATGRRLSKEQIRDLLAGEDGAGLSREQLLALLAGQDAGGTGLDADALAGQLAGLEADVDGDGSDDDDTGMDIGAWIAALVSAQQAGGSNGDGADALQRAVAAGKGGQNAGDRLSQLLQGLGAGGSAPDDSNSRDGGFDALLGSVDTRAAASRGGNATPTLQLSTPVGQPGFTRGVADQVTWMVNNGTQNARVTLDPPDLGPLEISVSTRDDRTSVSIVAHHAGTRDALMADSARLRAMLADNGFSGVEVSVRDGSAEGGNAQAFGDGGAGADGGHSGDGGGQGSGPGASEIRQDNGGLIGGNGLVDHYV
ncbi:hypothetical protein KBTX_00025 [wastewater metagenome]|uniref:Flagellar hook-length control protein-like C-terminal domain-containing protein n=2 Tax=unclassified sequences TaxID=12908 RepID=A0A5B8RAG1_9ZZZZ|nr:flagellar hook-length control protein FliK [Arhodomonas sp. KWT]QEA03725.1 hypothetical protein KBTEX_00025 [uncultured organism]